MALNAAIVHNNVAFSFRSIVGVWVLHLLLRSPYSCSAVLVILKVQMPAGKILGEAADRQEAHTVDRLRFTMGKSTSLTYGIDAKALKMIFAPAERVKYACFEERSRSVSERALEVDHRSSELCLRYTEFEMRNEFLNHARNVLDLGIQILPRAPEWYKFVYMVEIVGDIPKYRAVFERWKAWRINER
jgi:hypothetical protein